jgi:hypothetical protein
VPAPARGGAIVTGRLSAIVAATGGRLAGADADFDGVSIDSRTLERGQLFFALKGRTGRDEQKIGEPVDIAESGVAHRLVLACGERHDKALRAAGDGPGKMQIARGRRAARQHEGA